MQNDFRATTELFYPKSPNIQKITSGPKTE